MFQNFPYTDMHQLNLDWIVKIAKDFLDQYTSIQDTITTGLESLDTKAAELEALLQEWYNTHSEDIAEELADALNSINQTLDNSLAEFATRAEAKAEETLESIPDDYTQVANETSTIKNGLLKGFTPFPLNQGYLNASGALVSSATDWRTSPFYPIVGNMIGIKGEVTSLSGTGFNICFYDGNRQFLTGKLVTASIVNNAIEIIPPANAKLFRFCNPASIFSNNTVYAIYDSIIDTASNNHFRKKLINLKNAGYINTAGNLVGALPWATTNFIYVHNVPFVGLIGMLESLGANGYNISLYDSEKHFIRGYSVYNYAINFNGYKLDTDGAYYIRISSNKDLYGPAYLVYSYMGNYKNLIDRDDCIDGYYVDYTTGNAIANTAYCVTPFINVCPGGVYRYTIKTDLGNEYAIQQCAFYDENMNYISGLANTGETHSKTILVPAGAYYVRWTIKPNYTKIQLETGTNETEYERYYPFDVDPVPCYVGSTREITSILVALKELPAVVPVYLDSETFNIVNEYTDYYGAGYWDSYAGYVSSDPFDRGLWLARGRKIKGTPRTLIRCIHDNTNANITRYFSVFANAENTSIEDIMIEMAYVRYAIHDDFSNDIGNGTIIFRNLRFSGQSTGQIIGGGMGYNNLYIIENCIFLINGSTWDIHYHNSTKNAADNINKIYIRNCWGYRDVGVEAYGSAQTMSSMMVSACKFRDFKAYRPDDVTVAPYMNVEMIKWCVETA